MDPIIIDELGSYASVERTSSGGWSVPATLTRTGIFKYVVDGKTINVLRPREEVLSDASLDSLAHCPVTVFHPVEREVTPKNYRRVVVGVVGSKPITTRGEYVAARLHIEDEDTGAKIDSRELCEVSLGYRAEYALNADGSYVTGEYNGEKYDRVQKNIRYNHVSLGPKGWGRAGRDVGIQLDGLDRHYVGVMNVAASHVIVDDAAAPLAPVAPVAPAPPAVVVDAAALTAERDRATAKADMLQLQVNALLAAAKPPVQVVDSAAVAARAALVADARVLAPALNCDSLTDDEVRAQALAAIVSVAGKSQAYVDAAFDFQVAHRKTVIDSHAQVASVARTQTVTTDAGEDKILKAYEANVRAYTTPAKA